MAGDMGAEAAARGLYERGLYPLEEPGKGDSGA